MKEYYSQVKEDIPLRYIFFCFIEQGLSPQGVLRRLENIVPVYRLRKPSALPSPYFLRARRRKQLSTVSYSLTRRFDQVKEDIPLWYIFF